MCAIPALVLLLGSCTEKIVGPQEGGRVLPPGAHVTFQGLPPDTHTDTTVWKGGVPLPEPLGVTVVDSATGEPLSGIDVQWVFSTGSTDSASRERDTTGLDGRAELAWTPTWPDRIEVQRLAVFVGGEYAGADSVLVSPIWYHVVEVVQREGLGFSGEAVGVNSRGQVIYPDPDEYGFGRLWENGQDTRLDFVPMAINDAGDILGTKDGGAVLRRNGVTYTTAETPVDLSSSGTVLLRTTIDGVFRWESWDGMLTTLLPWVGDLFNVQRINAAGDVAGTLRGNCFVAKMDGEVRWLPASGYCWTVGALTDSGYVATTSLVSPGNASGSASEVTDIFDAEGACCGFSRVAGSPAPDRDLLDAIGVLDDGTWVANNGLSSSAGAVLVRNGWAVRVDRLMDLPSPGGAIAVGKDGSILFQTAPASGPTNTRVYKLLLLVPEQGG